MVWKVKMHTLLDQTFFKHFSGYKMVPTQKVESRHKYYIGSGGFRGRRTGRAYPVSNLNKNEIFSKFCVKSHLLIGQTPVYLV